MTTFAQILGQDSAIQLLRRAAAADRLPHGLLFAGPSGVGKATTARALAALVLCQSPTASEPCGRCESCRLMSGPQPNHPDYRLITKELIRFHDKTGLSKGIDLSIRVVRAELIEPAGRKPVMGRGKVFIVEEAELMSAAAQNALLKTLEEPAGRTAIILLTDEPGALLATVRSRCQLVPFAPLAQELIVSQLIARGIAEPLARSAADLAEGSLGQALRFAQQGTVDKAAEFFSIIDGKSPAAPHEWLKSAADEFATAQLAEDELASKDQATRQGLALYLRLASQHLRRKLPGPNEDATERVCRAIDAVVQAEQFIDANVNIALALQQLSIQMRDALRGSSPAPKAAALASGTGPARQA